MAIPSVYEAQALILLVLGLAALGMEIFAVIDIARRPAPAFTYADKRTKNFWLILCGVAALVGFASLFNPTSLVGLLGVVAAGVYLADVRPAVSQYRPRGRGASGRGPYGSW